MSSRKADRFLDLRRKVCPYPTLNTCIALKDMAVGEVLEILSDFYPTRQTIPDLMRDLGYPCEVHESGQHEFRFLIRKT